jgi:hypothetical protein
MEIITIQSLVKLAKKGHYPLFKKQEVVQSLSRTFSPNLKEEHQLKKIIKKMKIFKTFERKKLFIQSLSDKEKEIFINHLYSQAHKINVKKSIKYN